MASTASDQASAMRRLLDATVTGDRAAVADLVTADVTAWSPNLFVTSRDELLRALEHHEDAFSGIEVRVQALDQVGDKAFAEWHVAVDHTGPLAVDDNLVIQPTGRRSTSPGPRSRSSTATASARSAATSTTSHSSNSSWSTNDRSHPVRLTTRRRTLRTVGPTDPM